MVSPAARETESDTGFVITPPLPTDRRSGIGKLTTDGCTRCDELQDALDDVSSRLLATVDAGRGAEAERAVAEGRIRELEYQLHMQNVELADLRQRLADRPPGDAAPKGIAYRAARRVYRTTRAAVEGTK